MNTKFSSPFMAKSPLNKKKRTKVETEGKKGLTLIWPADWTHTHRGVISQTKEKTIITGWIGLHNPGAK